MNRKNLWLSVITVLISIGYYFLANNSLTTISAQEQVQTCGYDIVQTYPHDPQAFTQGLIYDQGELYESTGLRGRSSLRRVELATGKVLQINNLDDRYFGEGMTLWQDRLVQLTWVSQTGFVYDQATLKQLATFNYPTEGWGLTHNDRELIMSDGSDTLYFLDPNTFQETNRIQVKDGRQSIDKLNELEYVNDEILANVWMSDRIARISPQTGQVLGWIDLSGIIDPVSTPSNDAVLNGIAYDQEGDRLFVTGKLWSKLFEIDTVCN
ncbi:MAG: glutaminyl-peptide cyclotransferase [Cyanobacteria bacterium P01_A01_bin.83]